MKDAQFLINNGVDINSSLELFGDMVMYNETLDDFLMNIDKKLNDIKTFKESSDMTNYAILVHSLKSDSKYLGFTKLAELSYNHEMASKQGNINFVYDNYETLISEANRIIDLVKQYKGIEILPRKNATNQISMKDKTILVVDDSELIKTFIKKIFKDTYEVLSASDGKEAIDIVELNPCTNMVGMLLDLNMPNVNGFEVLDYFDKNNLFSKVSVAIVTGEDLRDTMEKASEYPIIDILTKPFNERDIKRVVDKLESQKTGIIA